MFFGSCRKMFQSTEIRTEVPILLGEGPYHRIPYDALHSVVEKSLRRRVCHRPLLDEEQNVLGLRWQQAHIRVLPREQLDRHFVP